MALGGGRRGGATLPNQRGEEAPRNEIQTRSFRARGGRSREEEETDEKIGLPLPLYSQGVRPSSSTAVAPAVVPLAGGSTARCSGSTAGVLAFVPLPLAVVPLQMSQRDVGEEKNVGK